MEIPEPELNKYDPREQEPKGFKHVVVLLNRGESPLSRDQLEKIVESRTGGDHSDIIVHFLCGGSHENGGLYPSLNQVCSPPNRQEYRSRYWHVEEPAVIVSPEAKEDPRKRYKIFHGPPKEVWEIIENPDSSMWKIEEQKTLKKMREILTSGGNVIEPWASPQIS
mgnify:CR=1 FL=1